MAKKPVMIAYRDRLLKDLELSAVLNYLSCLLSDMALIYFLHE